MHCPNCRHDNPSTTRFCNACGAVLVEDAPGLGRRRVLRPWGLRRSAPPTVSPELPEIPQSPAPRFDALSRLDLILAGCVVAAIVAATAWFPGSFASDATPVTSAPPVGSDPVTIVVSTPLQATSVVSPGLVEPATAPVATPAPAKVSPRPPRAEATRPAAQAIVPVAPATIDEAPAVVAAPPAASPLPVVPAPRDRWDPLRDALAACRSQGNVFERAMCEQGARIRHCTEHWDQVELCPSGRPAITQ